MAHLKLFVLGQPRLERDDTPIELNLRKALALLVYLAVSGQWHSRDALATVLWPESDGREGRARLRRTLHRLTQAIGDDILDSGAEAIRLHSHARLWLDSAAFRQHATAGLAAAAQEVVAPERLAHLNAAVELYTEDFLAGFTLPDSPTFDEWQFFQSESLRQVYGQALEQLVQAYRGQQAWDQAIGYARRWLALDGLHEPAHRILMRLYAWAGQHAAAVRQYQECVRILDAELGAAPEEETTALYEAIRTRQLAPPEATDREPGASSEMNEAEPYNRYVPEERLAEGGQGEVHRGRDQLTGQIVAIKWLKTELADRHLDLVARFVREGAVLRRLNHPNIVGILDTFEHAGRYAIVMEYVPGGSLCMLLEQARQLPLSHVLTLGLELADALSRAHHLGIIHRDLKPENVLLAADGTPRLTDFGLARLEWDDARLTQSGTLFGSPAYMSPEAVRGEELDARSDIWSLGVLLYELLAGRRPFEGVQITPVLVAIQADPVPDLREFRPGVPPSLVELLERMLVKERAQRLPSMRQVAAALEAIRDGRAVEAILPEQRGQAHADEAPVPVADTPLSAGHAAAQPFTGAELTAPVALHDDSPSVAAESPVFVAREQELGRLDALLDAALFEQSQVAFVVGEAGQGKTALLQAFARRAQLSHPDLIVAGGNCNAYTGAGDPYLPFREILELLTGDVEARALAGRLRHDHAARLRHTLPAAVQALVDVGPDLLDTFVPTRGLLRRATAYAGGEAAWVQQLQELVSRKVTRPTDPRQQDLFEQYARVMQHLARRSALLLILDDLQWADRGSTDLLLHLGRRLKGCRVLIVGAYRPADIAIGRGGERHPLEHVVGELQRDLGEIRLDLGHAEGRAFVDALLDSESNLLGEAFRTALYQQTAGHPLFTIELLRDLQERGELARDAAGCWTASPHLHWTRLPARVEGVIGERVGRLDARLREVLQVASVEGEEFTAEVVARVVGADEHEIVRQLSRELDQTHHLVRALGVRRDDGLRLSRYRFQHILIQRYLYHCLDDVERPHQHEAVGHALEVRYGTRVAEIAAQLARHFAAAQMPAKAIAYIEQAGDQARHSAALEEAVHYYQAALEVLPTSDLTGRAHVLRKLGECQWVRGHLQDALAPFEACYALYESLGDREGAGAIQRLLGRLYWEQGDRERSLRHYNQALALLESGPESVELAWAISSISQMYMLASAYDQAISWGQRALSMAERLEAEQVMVPTLANMGNAYVLIGDAEGGQAMLRRSWQRAVELNLPYEACRAAYLLGERKTDLGLSAEAQAIFEELRTYAARKQMPLGAGGSLISLARLDWLSGRWQSALARRQEILAWISRGQSISYLEVVASTTFAWMHNDLGQAEVAHQMLEQARPKVGGRAEIQTTGPHLGQQVRALGMLGFEAEATEAARQFLELIEQQQDYWDSTMPHLAVCRWFASRAAGMREELKTSLAQLGRADARLGSPTTAAALSEGRGLVALSEGDALRAVEYLQHAAAQWQALGYPYDQVRVLVALGRALSQAGAAGEARAALDQALSLVESLAAQLDAAELNAAFLNSPLVQELRSARSAVLAAPPPNLAPQPAPFSSRQKEQQIRFCTAPDGVRIAYATVGVGPVLVKAANWLSHLEFDWNSPVWHHWLAGLSQRHTLVRYDERGCGLSDWDVDDFSVDAWVRDLETVVDTLGLERFPLLGISQGGPVAIAYAVRHPERVSHLILYGSYARGWWKRDISPQRHEETETLLTLSKLGWGRSNPAFRQVFTSMFIPDATTEQMRWFNDLQRMSTSPENAVKFLRAFYEIDVSDLAPRVTVPTLVLHASDDGRIPFAAGRELAALIPGARFVPLESNNHILLESEPAWQRFLAEVHHFLGEDTAGRSRALGQPPAESPAHRLISSETPAASPPDRATEDRSSIESGQAVPSEWRTRHNLPAQPTPFIGRDQELADLQRLLDDPACRLLTLVGPGGIGKTRLALAAASAALEAFPQGVYFVPLAPLTSADYIVPALAESLDLRFYETSDPQQQLLDYLREKLLLLVLDNFEHVLEGAALAADILAAAPRVKLLVTSRERLNLSGESVYPLGSMAVPERASDPNALEYGAMQLLMQQARLARPDSDLRAYNLDALVRICRLVQGMPLALVLAAGWLEVLSFEEIADEIAQRLDFLEGQARDLPERQRSVRATFDYSWKRLAVEDQHAFMQLSIFRGGFTRLAALAVAGADVRTLRTLVHKSFLSVGQGDRYEIHELLRQYAEEHLEATGEAERVHNRHLAYFLDLAEAMVSDLRGPHQKESLDRLEQEHDNLRAALRWALDTQPAESSLRLAGALWWLWDRRGHFSEGREWLEAALQLPWQSTVTHAAGNGSDVDRVRRARARALFGAGVFAWYQTDYARACVCLEESAAMAEEAKDAWCQAYALCRLGRVFNRLGDRPGARALAEQSLAIFRRLGDTWGVSMPLRDLGWIALAEGDIPTARALLDETLALRREMQDWTDIADALVFLGDLHWVSGDYEQAAAFLTEALALSRELRDKLGMASALGRLGFAALAQSKVGRAAELFREGLRLRYELGTRDGLAEDLAGLAGVAVAQGDDEHAARLIGALEAFFSPLDAFLAWIHLRWHERTVAEARAALGEERFAALHAAARTLPLEQVIADALAEDTGVPQLPAPRQGS